MKQNNLGNYDTIYDVWSAYPEGGKEGDCLFIDGVEYVWDKYDNKWMPEVSDEDKALKSFYGEVDIHKGLRVGEDIIVNGNLITKGAIISKKVSQPSCGLFSSVEALQKAYPKPYVGMWAAVGNAVPAPIYRCETIGVWTPTGDVGYADGRPGKDGENGAKGDTGERGPQGPQGNSGYTGAADELEVVNNLTQGGATAALSAEMGKELADRIVGFATDIESEIFNIGGALPIEFENYFIAVGTGEITKDEVSIGAYATSRMIEVSKVKVIGTYGYAQSLCAFYDKDKNLISTFPSAYFDGTTAVNGLLETIVGGIPDGTAFVRYTLTRGASIEVYDAVEENVIKLEEDVIKLGEDVIKLEETVSTAKKPLSVNQQIVSPPVYNRLLKDDGSDIYADGTYIISGYVSVKGGDTYQIKAAALGGFCFYCVYDENKKVLQHKSSSASYDVQMVDVGVTIPQNGRYIRVAGMSDIHPYEIYDYTYTLGSAELTQKKWAAIGDSLTERNHRTDKNYADYISEKTGIEVVNLGIGGTGYRHSMPFYTRVAGIPSDVSVITIFGSGNDLNQGYTMGDVTSTDVNTICGSINRCITDIQAAFPLVPFGIITPTPWENWEPNEEGNPLIDYCGKIVEICRLRGVPCLDLYHCSNLHPSSAAFRAVAYSKDDGNGVHPDENGHRIIYPRILSFIKSLL